MHNILGSCHFSMGNVLAQVVIEQWWSMLYAGGCLNINTANNGSTEKEQFWHKFQICI
jgi:hypothetical protein